MNNSRIVLAGTNSGVGKTTITLGLLNGFKRKGVNVKPYKSGPDYIDPAFHTFVTGNKSRNLDAWLMDEHAIKHIICKSSQMNDLNVVEGVMGLFDGHIVHKHIGSTAHISKITQSPVVLIIDGSGMSTSAAALVKGYKEFDLDVNLGGIIINKIGAERHYSILKNAIEEHTGVKCYGYLRKNTKINLSSRHLGLIPAGEVADLKLKIDLITDEMEETIDFEGLLELANQAPKIESNQIQVKQIVENINIAIPMDNAFTFYYQDNLDLLEELGATLKYFSPLSDSELPQNIDGIYMGGGFPEVFAKELALNTSIKESIHDFVESGGPVYAECGGLMYMCKSIVDLDGNQFQMVGVLDNNSVMTQRLQRFGYVDVEVSEDTILGKSGTSFRAHEFHRSELTESAEDKLCYSVKKDRGNGNVNNWSCGYMYKNFVGGYAHIHFYNNLEIPKQFLLECLKFKARG